MPAARRPQLDDRRRLVIYSQRYSADAPAQSQRSRAVDAALRGARKPAAAYGWRVQRRLRARLFGIVPVRRRALLAVVAGIFGMVALLALGHWASLWWPPIALRPPLARPLRLDRPDSFGTWLGAVMMAAAAGGSFMVYQLRRYRADDYRGHYRMWRIAIVLCLLASVDAVIHLASWLGAAVDVALAERDALAGADWIRLLLTVGGAAFGLRMTVELARCRTAAATMVLSLALLGLSSVTRWNLLRIEQATAVTWLPITLLAGRGLFLVAVVIYLRMLYREVRKLESSDHLSRQLRKLVQWRRPVPRRKGNRGEPDEVSETQSPAAEPPQRRPAKRSSKRVVAESTEEAADGGEAKPGWRSRFGFGRRRIAADPDATTAEDAEEGVSKPEPVRAKKERVERQPSREKAADAEDSAGDDDAPPRKRFGLPFGRRAKSAEEEAAVDAADDSAEQGETPSRKRFGLPFGRRAKSTEAEAAVDAADDSAEQGETPPRKRFGLPFGRRTKSTEAEAAVDAVDDSAEQGETPPRKRFGLPFRRRAAAAEDAGADGEEAAAEEKPVKRSRFSLLRRRSESEDEADEDAEASNDRGQASTAVQRATEPPRGPERRVPERSASDSDHDDDDSDDSDLDPEGVDWETLNKSERRRARKLLKRQGKAA